MHSHLPKIDHRVSSIPMCANFSHCGCVCTEMQGSERCRLRIEIYCALAPATGEGPHRGPFEELIPEHASKLTLRAPARATNGTNQTFCWRHMQKREASGGRASGDRGKCRIIDVRRRRSVRVWCTHRMWHKHSVGSTPVWSLRR